MAEAQLHGTVLDLYGNTFFGFISRRMSERGKVSMTRQRGTMPSLESR